MHNASRALSFKRKRRWGNLGCRREISDPDDCMPVTINSKPARRREDGFLYWPISIHYLFSTSRFLKLSPVCAMDFPYDHIQEEIIAANDPSKKDAPQGESSNNAEESNVDLNTELQETFRAFSASPWGVRIGGLWDNVRKQGENYYEGARQEYSAVSEEAVKGFSDLRENIVGRTRGLSLNTGLSSSETTEKDEAPTPTGPKGKEAQGEEGDGADEGFFSRFKAEAAKRLKELEKAEEAADEAILRFGMSIRQKLQDAVSIVPPTEEESGKVLFESKDAEGKRVIHATRFEAQLHVIHSNLENFTKDPESEQWPAFHKDFNVEAKTDEIASDLENYPELRSAMEKLVPEQVEYGQFWSRYYFLRFVIETEEQKRKELLKGRPDIYSLLFLAIVSNKYTGANVNEEEEVTWDDDSESESEEESDSDESDDDESDSDSPSTPQVKSSKPNPAPTAKGPAAKGPAAAKEPSSGLSSSKSTLKPTAPRSSNDQQSQPDSESSYDVVSGTASRTPGSPKEKSPTSNTKGDDSDEDWE